MGSHIPVLTNQVLYYLNPQPGEIIIDCTLGYGGHSEEILKKINGKGRLYGIDADERNLVVARSRLVQYPNFSSLHDNFENLDAIGEQIKIKEGKIDAILFDLGLSSLHVDDPSRGFSFKNDGPLDMRFDTRQRTTASDIINNYSLKNLIEIFRSYGEECHSKRIAEEIVRTRRQKPFTTTNQLAEFITLIIKKRPGQIHPATKIFQALRMATNRELEVLQKGIMAAIELLSPGGRMVIISFHSLEDRIVKNYFKAKKQEGTIEILTKKPIVPDEEEININRRSRSAKLRAAKKN